MVNTKADTVSNTIATTISNDQTSETSNVVTLRNNQKNENSSNEAADSVQNVTSNTESNVSAENKAPSTENATLKSDTPEVSAPVESNANTSAAPAMRMATSTTTGYYRNAAGIVNQNNINTQPAKENQELANKTNLTSSDNYSSNIYKGKDENYYKIVTIYGNDYVYRAADIQANGTAFLQKATTAEDTKNNINISKEDLGNGKTRWTVVFFPNKGLQNVGSNLSGLTSTKFGIALTSDYQIDGNVDMKVISDPKKSFTSYTFEPGSNSATTVPIQNPSAEKDFSFNPNTDVDPNTGLINSETMLAYNNQYLQGPYYFTTATNTGAKNLWQTYFKDAVEYNNAYDGSPYLGGNHDFHLNNFEIKNETGVVDGAKYRDKIIYGHTGV
ncbi:LEA family epithelial adhesin [Ligilactobacillus salivarius]|uniref:LEA family epithelial adhesin n=1 Tax=Ligilactobacillus salivarius TaxID=1624 RepID=UPI0030D99396